MRYISAETAQLNYDNMLPDDGEPRRTRAQRWADDRAYYLELERQRREADERAERLATGQ